MLLHQINFDNRDTLYCGPHAIAAATGLSPQGIVDLVRAQRILGRSGFREPARGARAAAKAIKSDKIVWMDFYEIAETLKALGYDIRIANLPHRMKVWQFIEAIAKEPAPGPHICRIGGHFFALSGCGRQLCDTHSGQPEATERKRYHGASLTHVLTIFP